MYIDIENADGTYRSKFSPHSIPEGNVWKYLWWCIKTYFYNFICIRRIWVTIIGIIYLYSNLLKAV